MTAEADTDAAYPTITGSAAAPPDAVADDGKLIPLFWHSNAPWVGTGYGTQSALFVPRIAALGYRCAFSAFYGLKGARLGWQGSDGNSYTVYPGGENPYSNDVLGAHVKHWFGSEGGLVVTLTDPWVLAPNIIARLPTLAWTPIDHDPLIPETDRWLRASEAIPVAMSRFGEEVMRDAGHKTVYYVPHGFDPAVFKPANRGEARKPFGIPQSAFVVGMVAANLGFPSRKSFSQAIAAFGIFQRRHPDALLYLHTKLESPDGEDLPAMCKHHGVRSMASDQYGLALGMPDNVVAALYSAFDVLLNPSMGEGFGVPILEAQACGTPCITTNFSAMPEVAPTEAGNWTVGGQKVWTRFESEQVTPDIGEIVDALEQAYAEDAAAREARRVSVYTWANENYRADDVTRDYWKPALENAAIEFGWRQQLMVRG